MRPDTFIRRAVVEKGAAEYALSSRILKRLGGVPDADSLDMDKETIRLVSFKGEFLKPCPGTKEYICCGYQILHVGTNCPMECSYCILQAYFNEPSLNIFVNLEDKLDKIGRVLDSHPEKIYRMGTGEFMDSLSLDHVVGWSDMLLPFFSARKNCILELKTKTDRIEGLLSSKYRDQIIVSWSLNSPFISSREEHGAPTLKKRLEAARKCQSEGYRIGFHFDPLVQHPNWKEGYMRTIEMMDNYVDPAGIVWISLGCLRYIPLLKTIIRKRHPSTHILDGEFIRGLDGKMRYFKPIRIDIYSFIAEILVKWHHDLGLYLCMESNEVWQKSLGWSPLNSGGLSDYLDKRVMESFE
jgi:spore photoproduct lyase